MTEQPFIFAHDTGRLFGMWHLPEAVPSTTAFLMSHPFGEEKLWSHRVYVSAARALAARGHRVLRFDYRGAGDSSGNSDETSLATHLEDMSTAFNELVSSDSLIERVGLVGLRLGAAIAAQFAEQMHDDLRVAQGPMVLWDPVMNGESYFQEMLRSNLATQLAVYGKVLENREVLQQRILAGGTVNVDGYEIGRPLFESCARPDLLTGAAKRHGGPVLVVQIAATEKQANRAELEALGASYSCGTFARVVEQPFWREIKAFYGKAASLQQMTLEWLEREHV